MHRYLPQGVEEGTPIHDNLTQTLSVESSSADNQAEPEETSPFEKYNPLLHVGIGVVSSSGRAPKQKKEVLSLAFIKKYIQYAKNKLQPVLTKGAAEWIVEAYASLRNEEMEKNTRRVKSKLVIRVHGL